MSSGETWLLNESLKGTVSAEVAFTSNSTDFTKMVASEYTPEMSPRPQIRLTYFDKGGTTYAVYYDNFWQEDAAYRTLTFATAPTGDLLTWLQNNGTKQ